MALLAISDLFYRAQINFNIMIVSLTDVEECFKEKSFPTLKRIAL